MSNPFPGLRPFEPDEDYLFFGRERQTDDLLRKLRTTRFLSILGTSGSGKSSLVRSGLIPTLYGGGMTRAGSQWRVAIMRPGEDPLGALAAALTAPEVLAAEGDASMARPFYEATLRASQLGVIECIRQSTIAKGDNVLLLVDQFEELFRYKRSRRASGRDDAVAFVNLLLAARESDVPCYVAITMRSDFIGDCMEFDRLPEAVNDGVYLVPRMTRDELRSAITGPVAVGGATIAPRLVARLLNDVGDDPDQLPILQHAMMRTWDEWAADGSPGGSIDLQHYEAIGTMRSALSRHAEEAYAELDGEQCAIAERMFKSLTDTGTDPRGVRRPAPLGEISALTGASADEVIRVVEVFRKPGRSFLAPPAGVALQTESILDISHESLMRVWERLSKWAEEEAKSAQLYSSVALAAQRHEDGVAGLWRDPELQLALAWREREKPGETWATRYDPSFARAMNFLQASEAERDREVREAEGRRKRELRQARRLAAVLSVASLVTIGLGAYAYRQKDVALEQATRAEKARAGADEARRRAETERTRAQTAETHAVTEKQNAVAAQTRAESEKTRAESEKARAEKQTALAVSSQAAAEAARQTAVINEQEAKTQKSAAEKATGEALTQKTKAETSEQETLRLSHLAQARALALKVSSGRSFGAEMMALEAERLNRENGGRSEDPDIFTAMRIALFKTMPAPHHSLPDAVRAMAVAPDHHTVFAGTDDGSVLQFDLRRQDAAVAVVKLSAPVRALAIRDRDGLLAAGTAGGKIVLRDLRNPGAAARELDAGTTTVSSLAFQPDGPLLAASSFDGAVRIWNLATGAAPSTIPHKGKVAAVAFSADGKSIAAALPAQEGEVIDVATLSRKPLIVCVGMRAIALSPDGKLLACGGDDGKIYQTRFVAGAAIASPLLGHTSAVSSLSYDPSGQFLASASSDGTVRLWDARTPSVQGIVLPGHESWVWSVVFAPDGQRIFSAGQDRTVRVWPAHTKLLATDLCRVVNDPKWEEPYWTEEMWRSTMPADVPYRPSPCTN